MIGAVLFDMDGVLLDSEEYICRAAIQMFKESGVTVSPEDFLPFVGAGENRYLGGVAEKYKLNLPIETAKARTYAIYDEIVMGKLIPLPGVAAFIRRCRDLGLRLAVASSADKIKVEINLRGIGLGAEEFDTVVNGLDVEHKKPAPDIYLLAASRLGVSPQQCLVVEDAVNGVQAARAAGMKCLALTTSFSAEDLKDADWIVPTLAEAPPAVLDW